MARPPRTRAQPPPLPADARLPEEGLISTKSSGPYTDEDATEIADQAPNVAQAVARFDREEATLPSRGGPAKPPPSSERLDVVPRNLLGKWGTDAVGAAAQRAQIERIEGALPHVTISALKLLRGELTQQEIESLEMILRGEHDDRGGEAALSPKRSLEHLINEPWFHELAPTEQARFLKAIAIDPRDVTTTKAAIAVLKTGVLKRLRRDDREKLLTIFSVLNSETRALLARLAARPLRGRSALEDRDLEEVSLIGHLHELAEGTELAVEMERSGVRRGRVLSLILGSLAHPERLPFEEGHDGVLSVLEFALADSSPAILARIWLQLVSGDMKAELAGGATIDLGVHMRAPGGVTFTNNETPLRVGFEQLAQIARPSRSGDRARFVMPGGHGVDADVISRALLLLYGLGFTVAAGAPNAMRHLARVSDDPQRVPPVLVSLLYERGERLFVFHRLSPESVLLRAPHGRSTKRKGAERTDPTRIVEDPDCGLDLMSRADLERWIGVALIPRA
jgi:hypothetical protein